MGVQPAAQAGVARVFRPVVVVRVTQPGVARVFRPVVVVRVTQPGVARATQATVTRTEWGILEEIHRLLILPSSRRRPATPRTRRRRPTAGRRLPVDPRSRQRAKTLLRQVRRQRGPTWMKLSRS